MIEEIAPAKINLYLHIGPTRADGLHDLASDFVFAEDGDRLIAQEANGLSLEVKGPFAGALAGEPVESNLVWKAAEALQAYSGVSKGARLVLDKRLPVAAGIGGGSADAAAALRALVRLWDVNINISDLNEIAFRLGADVPACLQRAPISVTGAGECLGAGPCLPPLWVCMVNPGVAMPTGPIFRAFDHFMPCPAEPLLWKRSRISNYDDARAMMGGTRNDLEPYAVQRAPQIQTVLNFLTAHPGVLAARMSGSGATSFALFTSLAAARAAANAAHGAGWWAMAAPLSR